MMLYGRTMFMLFISLFTSRVTLQALGVNNYGIQSAVGGVMAMFSIVSGSLSKSISRYITFELGHGDKDKLNRIFCTSLNIQLLIGFLIIIIGETIGVWFLNTKMNIPADRMTAANWVLQFSIWSFFIGLTQVPYGACIIGHERMSVFAYFGILNAVLKLVIVYLLYISPFDKLISFAALGFIVSIGMRMAQRIYCIRHFEECHYKLIFDKELMKDMSGFAGWSFLTNTAWIFNTSGLNILINIFFGVSFNAARGLAGSIEGHIKKFYGDFMTAINPQITKSYAAGQIDDMHRLVCRGTRLSYFLMFTLTLPFMFEAYAVLYLWLGQVPEYTVLFFRLSTIAQLVTLLGQTGVTACMATGNIKWYTIIITSVGFLVFPLTWIAFKLGMPVESSYIIYIIIYALLNYIRLLIMKRLLDFPIMMYVRDTLIPVLKVTIISIILPLLLYNTLEPSILKSLFIIVISLLCASATSYYVGLNENERLFVISKVNTLYHKFLKH